MRVAASIAPFRRSTAAMLLLFSTGVLLFWVDWFATGKYLQEGTVCYRHFENSFPLPDGVMAILLIACAFSLLRGAPHVLRFGLTGAGMALYLCAMDTCYHLQHGNFSDWSDESTWERAGISVATLLIGAGFPCYLHRYRDFFSPRGLSWNGALPALLAGLFQAPGSLYAVLHAQPAGLCWLQFQAASLLGAVLLLFLGIGAIAIRVWRKGQGGTIPAGLATGVFLFWALITASFALISAV